MYCYKVVDDVILDRKFRKKCSTDKEIVEMVKECTGDDKVLPACDFVEDTFPDMYTACKELTCLADEFDEYEWFVSMDNPYVLAAAILRIFSKEKLWEVMQDKAVFEEWVRKNVR